jgi:hypothetical protein
MPLDAKVISLENLLLKYPSLDVPNYQRTFRWPEEHITNLFQDILNGLDFSGKGEDRGHFLGSIVVCRDEATKKLDLVDGQQRLTTLTIMLWSLAKLADDATKERARKGILQGDQSTPKIIHKTGNKELCSDREAYRAVICGKGDSESAEEGIPDLTDDDFAAALRATMISKAANCLDKLAEKACEAYQRDHKQTTKSQAAAEIYKRMAEGIKLIIIETDQRKEGMRVFASINAQGTKLEPWELIMSAFYTHGPDETQQKAVELTFEQDNFSISKVLGAKDDDSAINNGLRTFWLATRRFTRMDDLFNEFNETLAKSSDPKRTHTDLLKQILFCTPLLKAFDTAPASVESIVQGKTYKMDCCYPVTVAMKDKLARPILLSTLLRLNKDTDKADEALRRVSYALERARLRLVICKYPANFIEKPYSQLAVEIYKGNLTNDPAKIEESVYDFLRGIKGFPSRDELEFAFQRYDAFGREQRLTKVIAARLQSALRNPSKLPFLYQTTPKKTVDQFKLARGLEVPADITEKEARKLGFSSAASLGTIGNSLGNLFMTEPDDSGERIQCDFNGEIEPSDLDEASMTARRDELAELAVRIWHF